MAKAVIELQKDIIDNKLDIISILRKAHLIASKLNLSDFNKWIEKELNGYDEYSDIPEYRTVIGEIKAKNPYYGLIPVMIPSNLASKLNSRKIYNSMSEIISLAKENKSITMNLPAEISNMLCENEGVHFPCYFIFGTHNLVNIIDHVKNNLLEWCIKLEKDGILGDDFEFNDKEIEKAKSIPQQVNYYGQVINGNVSNSQVTSGNNNNIELNFNDAKNLVDEIKKTILNEKIDDSKKQKILEILEDIDKSIKQKKKISIIKATFIGLKNILLNVGANVAAALIAAKITGL